MTTLILRRINDHFVLTGPDIEPMKFKSRLEAKDWCRWHPRLRSSRSLIKDVNLSTAYARVLKSRGWWTARSSHFEQVIPLP